MLHSPTARDLGAENRALPASLIETCKLHGVNPEAWFADVLTRLVNGWPNRRLTELTPRAWKARPQHRRPRRRVIGVPPSRPKPSHHGNRKARALGASLTPQQPI
jgi:hypothetical protein